MNSVPIRVAIVSPVHNRREITIQCLKSLSRIDSEGLDVQIFIVDDGSTDGTSEAIRREFPEVHCISGNGDLWYTEGTNVGIRAALEHDPKYILAINDDSIFDSRSIKYLVETAERFDRSVVGPLLLLWDQPHRIFQIAPIWKTLQGGWQHWSEQTVWTVPEKPFDVDVIVGNCVLYPASAVREHGLMDSLRFPNFGDAEYTPRLKRGGYRLLIEPRARVFCQPNEIPPSIRSMTFRKQIHALIVDLKNGHNLRRTLYGYMEGGPSKISGIFAFLIFLVDLAIGRNRMKTSQTGAGKEPPLSETLADKVVDE